MSESAGMLVRALEGGAVRRCQNRESLPGQVALSAAWGRCRAQARGVTWEPRTGEGKQRRCPALNPSAIVLA